MIVCSASGAEGWARFPAQLSQALLGTSPGWGTLLLLTLSLQRWRGARRDTAWKGVNPFTPPGWLIFCLNSFQFSFCWLFPFREGICGKVISFLEGHSKACKHKPSPLFQINSCRQILASLMGMEVFRELQNGWGWKESLRSFSPTTPLKQVLSVSKERDSTTSPVGLLQCCHSNRKNVFLHI